eukprot:TRINITY_DN37330_c0_g1_i1.p2 TRINITY_DN37330_c0_g1~~TRINITY_DN37330_c0_g1_i1.p2  ORF type:complete len:129 (+),score=27.84 TRINITY_DN37330_c0_g1_i1:2-388(+)
MSGVGVHPYAEYTFSFEQQEDVALPQSDEECVMNDDDLEALLAQIVADYPAPPTQHLPPTPPHPSPPPPSPPPSGPPQTMENLLGHFVIPTYKNRSGKKPRTDTTSSAVGHWVFVMCDGRGGVISPSA